MRSENFERWRRWSHSLPVRLNGGSDDLMEQQAHALALYMIGFGWDHFLTLTAKAAMTVDGMFNALKRYHRRLTRIVQRPVPYFWAVEKDSATGTSFHAHALIAGTKGIPIASLRRPWKYGHTDATIYDAKRFGALYVAKDIRLDADNYDISFKRPPQRADWDAKKDTSILERAIRSRRKIL